MAKKFQCTPEGTQIYSITDMKDQQFYWKALGKGMNLSEMNGDKYQDIDKSKLTQLILTGPDWRVWINTTTGEIYFNNQRIEWISQYYNLPVSYAEGIIQFKNGNQLIQNKVANLGPDIKPLEYGKVINGIIVAHYIGYKFHYDCEKVQILIRVIPDDPTTTTFMDTKMDIKVSVTDLTTQETTETVYEVVK